MTIHAGLNLREALDAARRLGCSIERLTRTGELMVSHPGWPRRMRVNARKRSAPRSLTSLLMQLERPGETNGRAREA